MNIINYHAHLYYDADTMDEAKELGARANKLFGVQLGRFHEKPVGPHPVWSCQITVEPKDFGEVISWLLMNHGKVDLFVHANTGRDWEDHTDYVMWIGKSYQLNLDIFRP